MSDWPVKVDPTAPFGERCVQVAVSALGGGKLAEDARLEIYRLFTACGYAEDISRVRTSCGIFLRGVMYWAGRPTPLGSPKISKALEGHPSWIDLAVGDKNWVPASSAAAEAVPGAIFLKHSYDHVGMLLACLGGDVWATAEGGGGPGTECKITWRKLDVSFPNLRGIWLPDGISGVGAPPPAPVVGLPKFPIVRGDKRRDVVQRWQRRLLARDPKCLPKWGPDGGYGDECAAATKALQVEKSLPVSPDSVNLATWLACE